VTDWAYSLRMRAAGPDGRHLTGGERLVEADALRAAAEELLERALARGAEAAAVRLVIDRRPAAEVQRAPVLPLRLPEVADPAAGLRLALEALETAGVSRAAGQTALAGLTAGFGARGALPGAVLLDATTGVRRCQDPARGVRARHFDYAPGAGPVVAAALTGCGLTHFRTREALALASKVAASGVAAELCWSDEPGYATGYVAGPALGYVRLPRFKPPGAAGGRVFFLSSHGDPGEVVQRLREEWLWLTAG